LLRVGFLFYGSDGWLGGVNYLWNLLFAIGTHERDALQPVLIAPLGADLFALDRLPGLEVLREPVDPQAPWQQLATTARRRISGRDATMRDLCARARLDVLSHSGTYGWRFELPTLPWIADFQHLRLPQNFTLRDRLLRTYALGHQLAEGTCTIVSSEAARADSARYYGPLARRTEVLRFVSQPRLDPARLPELGALQARYGIPARYFFLPNQFWRHKNHTVVVDALESLAARGVRPHVVLTGKGEDYRAPAHYAALMAHVQRAGLREQFQHLGIVPHEDLGGLMRHALAVINPSHFEGWSTTVEEARSLGKATILSDIDVHREQDPPGATYFRADDARALAEALERGWDGGRSGDAAREASAAARLPERTAAFASRYRTIVEDACRRR
jgi:glycosyltransferase involved in cell wall biosynthesis